MRKIVFIIACLLFWGTPDYAQEYLYKATKNDKVTFLQLQESFLEWSKERNLADTKGWKWFKRWEQHYAERANPDGTLADPSIFYEAALRHQQLKNSRSNGNSNWLPMGPHFLPASSHNPASGHGMGRINCVTFHPTDANTFWAGVAQGGVWKTTNGGQSWIPLNNGLPILRISDIAVDPNNADVMYACLGDYEYNGVALNLDDRKRHTHYGIGIYKTTNGGLTWSPTGHVLNQTTLDYSLLRSIFVNPNNSDHVVAGGFEGVWKSTDGGATWTNTLPNTIIGDIEQDPMNPNVLYGATSHIFSLQTGTAGIVKSTDFGATWTPLATGIPAVDSVERINIAIASSDPDYVYALACDKDGGLYGVYQSTNSGTSWIKKDNSNGPNILAWFSGVGETGGQGTYDLSLTVHPSNKNIIYAGGVNIWGSVDGGTNWEGASFWTNSYGQSVHADHHQFKYNPLDNKFYTCNDGGIMRTDSVHLQAWVDVFTGNDWGTVWENLSSGMQITAFYRLDVDNGRIIAGAQDNSTFYFNGTNWVNMIGGDGMDCLFHPTNPNLFWGSWQYGNLARTNNEGLSFANYLTDSIKNTVGEEGEWVTPWMYAKQAGALYAGYGNLWKSTNDGTSWTRKSSLPNMAGVNYPAPASALAHSTNNNSTIYMAKRIYHAYNSNSEVWMTTNDGNSWSNITAGLPDSLYLTGIAVDDDNPQLAWVTCSGFLDGQKVYQTTNGGTTWTNISHNLPNIPVNSIVLDETSNEHVLYIGTDLGVYHIDDNSTTWQLYGTNLPNVIIGDLAIDYNTQSLYVATFGRGIWKTNISLTLGATEAPISAASMRVIPNPNQGNCVLTIESPMFFSGTIRIVDVMGREVHHQTAEIAKGKSTIVLNLDVADGVYFAEMRSDNRSKVQKFIVSH